jgi:hypothetical protein
MPDHHPAPPQAPSIGELVELSRYRVASGERIVCGQRIDGVVHITDVPGNGNGDTYDIEHGLTSHDELLGIVCDYVQQAARWDDVPMLHPYGDNDEAAR